MEDELKELKRELWYIEGTSENERGGPSSTSFDSVITILRGILEIIEGKHGH